MFGTVDRRAPLAAPLPDGLSQDPAVDDGLFGHRPAAVAVELPEPSEAELAEARLRSARSGFEMVDLRRVEIDGSAAAALPVSIARRHRAAVIGLRFGVPLIALSAPENLLAIDDIYLAAGTDVLIVVAPERQVEACVEALYPADDEAAEVGWPEEPEESEDGTGEAANEASVGYGAEDVDWYRVGAVGTDGTSRPAGAPDGAEPIVEPAGATVGVEASAPPDLVTDAAGGRNWLDPVDDAVAALPGSLGVVSDPPLDRTAMPSLPSSGSTDLPADDEVATGQAAPGESTDEAPADEAPTDEVTGSQLAGDEAALPWWMQASPIPPTPFDEAAEGATSFDQAVASGLLDASSPFDTSLHGTDLFDPAVFDAAALAAAYDPPADDPPAYDPPAYDQGRYDPAMSGVAEGAGVDDAEASPAGASEGSIETGLAPGEEGPGEVDPFAALAGGAPSPAGAGPGAPGLFVPPPFDSSFDPSALDPSTLDATTVVAAPAGIGVNGSGALSPGELAVDPFGERTAGSGAFGDRAGAASPLVPPTPPFGQFGAEPAGWATPGWVPPGIGDGQLGGRAPEAEPEPEAPAPWHQQDVGDVLAGRGVLSDEQLATARETSRMTGRPLRAVLSELQLVNERFLLEAVAEVAGRQLVDLDQWPIDPRAGRLLPESVARRYGVLPIGFEGGRPIVATSDPSDVVALDDVRTLLGGDIDVVVSERDQIEVYLGRVYRRTEETDLAAHNAALAATGTAAAETRTMANLVDLQVSSDEAPVVKFVNLVLQQALHENASDVHIEPMAKELVVRCRIDGVLHQLTTAPKAIQGNVTSRLKVMAGLDIAEHRVPQDGRFALGAGNRQVDLRLATLPTVHGEKIVMRILDKSTAPLELDRLGFLPRVLERYQTAYRRPAGTILVTGPTGSGKSTTLYATLAELNSPERNVITVEDPVEYQMVGVNQVQVNPKAGLTFASALRSILRADPDIVLVGEVRDKETATIAVEAALTGHLVLSSLHTNDAVSTPMRLIEMGVEPFLVGSAIDCILAQRLGRILCQRCAEPYEPSAAELRAAGWDDEVTGGDTVRSFRRPRGCQACSNTGYRGRVAIHEVLLVDEGIERAILDRAPTDVIGRLARDQGMTSLRWDGLHKAALGITSLEEIMRVVV